MTDKQTWITVSNIYNVLRMHKVDQGKCQDLIKKMCDTQDEDDDDTLRTMYDNVMCGVIGIPKYLERRHWFDMESGKRSEVYRFNELLSIVIKRKRELCELAGLEPRYSTMDKALEKIDERINGGK